MFTECPEKFVDDAGLQRLGLDQAGIQAREDALVRREAEQAIAAVAENARLAAQAMRQKDEQAELDSARVAFQLRLARVQRGEIATESELCKVCLLQQPLLAPPAWMSSVLPQRCNCYC